MRAGAKRGRVFARYAAPAIVAAVFVAVPIALAQVPSPVPTPAPVQRPAPAPSVTPPPDGAVLLPAPPPALPVAKPILPADPGVVIPKRPPEPRAAKAYSVFETHCARCHQTGKLENPLASGSIANILSIDRLAADPRVVRPGIPDASLIYDILVTRHAPLEIYGTGPEAPEPQLEEIQAVREWIRDLNPRVQSCPDRKPLKQGDRDTLMREAQRLERESVKDLRFVSLEHLYEACAPLADIKAYGQALNKLFNSLSWVREPAKLTALDATETLFSVRLSDFGWVSGHWDLIERDYPKIPGITVPDDIVKAAGTATPLIHGDWLAAAAGEPPLYYALLGLPATLSELATLNGVDFEQSIASGAARRIAVRNSAITRGNRMIERHAALHGPMWLTYDFATSTGAQDLFAHPLGPKATPTIKAPFKPDEIRSVFALPNGFFGYGVFDNAGNRVDRVLPGIEKEYAGTESNALEPVTKAGSRCFSCHVSGIRAPKDDLRPNIIATPGVLPADISERALTMHASDSETSLLASGDNDKYREAMALAGVDADLRVNGEEIVTALARRYRGGSDVKAAVAEAGLDRDEFVKTLSHTDGSAAALARRLQQGVLPRADLDRLFALLNGVEKPQAPKGSGGFLRDVKSEIGLSVWIDKLLPSKGDLVTIRTQSDTDCYLTLISIDAEGKGTVIFPNDFEKENLIHANATVRVPGVDAPYQLRFKADGTETLIGRCSTSPNPPTGIEHDYERQRFTVLGNWEIFIQDTLVTEMEMRRSPEKAERARTAKAQAARRRRDQGVVTPKPDTSPGVALRDGRAVVVIGRD